MSNEDPLAAEPPAEGSGLRVLTWNLRTSAAPSLMHLWRRRRRLVTDVLHDHDADLVALQEVRPAQLAWVRGELTAHDCTAADRKGNGRDEHGVLLSRTSRFSVTNMQARWLSETPEVPGSRSWGTSFPRFALLVDLEDTGTTEAGAPGLRVIVVHLDHASKRARTRSCKLLANWIDECSDMPTILLGDLNTGVDDPLLGPLWDAGLRDAHARLPAKGAGSSTFHGYRGTTKGRRIDAILVSSHWEVTVASLLHDAPHARRASDHWPVAATLRQR